MKNEMYSKIQKLETLLTDLSESLKITELKRYTANQYFKAEINLAEGSTLTINMNNALFSLNLINQCQQIINDIKPYIPHNGNNFYDIIENHKKTMITNVLINNNFRLSDTANELGISFRQLRYSLDKHKEYFKQLKLEKENCYGSNQEKTIELGPAS